MKIKRIELTNFRRFADFSLDLDEQLTVLVARNGAGKSSVLDGIAIALGQFLTRLPGVSGINPKDTDFRVYPDGRRPPYMRIACATSDGVEWDRTERRDQSALTLVDIPSAKGQKALFDQVDKFIDLHNAGEPYELPVFVYYGTGRGVFDVPQRKRGFFGKEFSRFGALDGALESRTNFRRFVEYFYTLEEREARLQKEQRSFDVELPEMKAIREAVHRLMPDFLSPRGAHPAGIMVDWLVDGDIRQLRIEQLSDGYRTTLAMVMDIAARMAEANPEMPDPLATEGVVLIDEIDLHLHPGWQQRILPDLQRTFPNVQFIVSTHSPQVISTVPPQSLRVIEWRGEQPVLHPVNFSLGAEAQQMLEEVLGVNARSNALAIVQKLKHYQLLVEQGLWDVPEALVLRAELDRWGAEYEPELLRLDMDIRLKEMDRNA